MHTLNRDVLSDLLAACKALLPYAESARVPGPAMSDPWGPPAEVIRRAKEAIARAEGRSVSAVEVYSRAARPECIYRYCPYTEGCQDEGRCQDARRADPSPVHQGPHRNAQGNPIDWCDP